MNKQNTRLDMQSSFNFSCGEKKKKLNMTAERQDYKTLEPTLQSREPDEK